MKAMQYCVPMALMHVIALNQVLDGNGTERDLPSLKFINVR
jgi:hypothetical protein